MLQELIALQQEVYEGNKARGFWEEGKNRNKGEAVMLIITELSEAVESHRKNRKAQTLAYKLATECTGTLSTEQWQGIFEKYIKDSMEDELADAVIRILDTTYGFEWDITPPTEMPELEGGPGTNFAEYMLEVTYIIARSYETDYWHLVIPSILFWTEANNIDLLWHVKAKLKYNATRPFKHGKSY